MLTDSVLDWIMAQPTQEDIESRRHNRPQTLSGANDSAVQLAGAVAALPRAGTQRWQVYECIRNAGWRGLTFSEIMVALDRTYNSVGPRVRELKKDGHVVSSGRTREGGNGAQQEVWVVTGNV